MNKFPVNPSSRPGDWDYLGRETVESAEVCPRFEVQKQSGSEWARVVDTTTGREIRRYSVLPLKRSKVDGWAQADRYAALLNTHTPKENGHV